MSFPSANPYQYQSSGNIRQPVPPSYRSGYQDSKPVNPRYQELIMNDSSLAAKDKNTALYKPGELKNLDLKTDGQPISYKPEYHPSSLMSNIFNPPPL